MSSAKLMPGQQAELADKHSPGVCLEIASDARNSDHKTVSSMLQTCRLRMYAVLGCALAAFFADTVGKQQGSSLQQAPATHPAIAR